MPFDAMTVTPTTIRDLDQEQRLLLAGAAIIETYGHTKHALGDIKTGFCVYGSLGMALGSVEKALSQEAHAAAMRLPLFIGSDDVCGWNNAAARTKEEVVAGMRGAALAH